MAPVYDFSWRTCPLGDCLDAIGGPSRELKGWVRALSNWQALLSSVGKSSGRLAMGQTVSRAQWNSFLIIREWWDGSIQNEALSTAARDSIKRAASPSGREDDTFLDIDRDAALAGVSTYHGDMLLLFQLEFLHESRSLHQDNMEPFLGLLHAQREKCAQAAAMQRVAFSFFSSESDDVSSEAVSLEAIGNCIGATIEPCPWLKVHETDNRYPFYLWDIEGKCTVQVAQLATLPDYVCVSHTWGRWRLEGEGAKVDNVPWDVPRNSRFNVSELPEVLYKVFQRGYIWFDLFCIPQDGSARAEIEISRQALIFSNAVGAIAWVNDNDAGWNNLSQAVKWFCAFWAKNSIDMEYLDVWTAKVEETLEHTDDNFMELMREESAGESDVTFDINGWFTSLWTLQEACLRPDLVIFDKSWRPLMTGKGQLITLDYLAALTVFISRGRYKSSKIKVPSGHNSKPSGLR